MRVYLGNQVLICTTNSNQCLTVPFKLFCTPQEECKFQKIYRVRITGFLVTGTYVSDSLINSFNAN